MSGKMLGLATLAALLVFAPQAEARRLFWWEVRPQQSYDYVDPYDPSYDPYADNQDATAQDMFNQDQYDQYVREMRRRHRFDRSGDRYDPALYDQSYDGGMADPVDPQYNDLQPKAAKPKKPKTVKAAVAKPNVETTTTASTGTVANTPVVAEAKKTVDTPKPAKGGSVTCAKGEEIVASYGFLDISQKSCEGSSLVYSAVRGKSNFEVEVNPSNGEVTAVRKIS
jgi:hypothetical protein